VQHAAPSERFHERNEILALLLRVDEAKRGSIH
jgi:hypothetical protein